MSPIFPPCGACEKKGCGAYHDQCEAFQEYLKQKAEIRKTELDENMRNRRPVMKKQKKDRLRGDYR